MTVTARASLTEEAFVDIDGEVFYAIPGVGRLEPFLMSIVSDDDHWMYVSSRGGLTAGRGDADSALFPYETDDRLHLASGHTGPATAIRGESDGRPWLWEPLAGRAGQGVQRNLYKSAVGNKVMFEEVNHELALTFRYCWANSDQFGFVRTASLTNNQAAPVAVEIIDGLLNLLPHGLGPATYQSMSNLTNAYKRSELIDADIRLAVYSLESLISDRAEPAEALTASVVWSFGLPGAAVSLDAAAIEGLVNGHEVSPRTVITGRPGAYLLQSQQTIDASSAATWTIAADVGYGQREVVELSRFLQSGSPGPAVEESVARGTGALVSLVAGADGLQRTGDYMACVHHFANVAFNAMRGGVFASPTQVERDDFAEFLRIRNRATAARHEDLLVGLPAQVDRTALLQRAAASGDPQLMRLTLGYMPLTFSRRHGDPSRPWNAFSIKVRDEAGNPVVHYEGNWRDIFQNWEALCMSFPDYLPSVVSVFLSASTPDGFNPYRITAQGIDWEVPEPDNPWSNIGYWGDHQITYLNRLLESTERFHPQTLDNLLGERWFAYADVPYRIALYADLVREPRTTIDYDIAAAARVDARVAAVGQDGKLVPAADGDVYLVTMVEKLLVPVLAKLSNLIPGGGIWMNTQRPEWNDANNALVGHGVSLVTASYLRRHMEHLARLFERSGLESVAVSTEVIDWLEAVAEVLEANLDYLGGELTADRRRGVVDALGSTFSEYRDRIYASGFSDSASLPMARAATLLRTAIRHVDDTIRRNQRPDGLYHSYNLVDFDDGQAAIEHLGAMLEGQVAVLSSGLLDPEERAAVLEALFASAMYRADQNSFMLYPARALPPFLAKNVVPASAVTAGSLLGELIAAGEDSIIQTDEAGVFRFNADCANEKQLRSRLDLLASDDRWRDLVARDRAAVMDVYEDVFQHHSYTGRSGSMYGYEGIGSIYWHMVAKLLVAVQESILEAQDTDVATDVVERLVDFYWRVRSGLGYAKSAAEFGAFPMDPYSHTPAHAGAQQPGMTGQVKEEILTRPAELGLRVDRGEIRFDSLLLQPTTAVSESTPWNAVDVAGTVRRIELASGSLGFTFCQVPIVVTVGADAAQIEIHREDGTVQRIPGLAIDSEISGEIFRRSGSVTELRVTIAAT